MAEIRVERKPQRKIWPLILGLLVAALLVWGLVATLNNNRDETDVAQPRQSSLVPMNDLAIPAIDLSEIARAA